MAPALTDVQRRRRHLRIFSWTGAGLLAGCLIALNFIASYLPLRLDTSIGRAYSISSGTKAILKQLDDTVLVRIMFSSQLPAAYKLNEQYVQDLLVEYKRASRGKVRVEYFDPGKSPQDRQEAISAGVYPVQLDVRERDRREVKECFMGISMFYLDRKEAIPIIQDTQSLEYEITQRIKKLVTPEKTSIGWVTAGDALGLGNDALQTLQAPVEQQFNVQTLDLTNAVPSTMKAVWLVGPSKPVDPAGVGKLRDYLNQGGTVGLLLDQREVKVTEFSSTPIETGLNPLLADWGVEMTKGLILDPRCDRIQIRAVQGNFQMINVVDYLFFPWLIDIDRAHPATKGIDGFSMPFSSPIEIKIQAPGVTYTALAKTSDVSWLDAAPENLSPLQTRERPGNAVGGPFPVAMLMEKKVDGGKIARLILFTSSKFINASYPPRQTNYSLFMNMLDWSVQDEILLSIRSKGASLRPIRQFPDRLRQAIKYVMIILLPLLSVIAGLLVWRAQKVRRQMLPLLYREA